MEKAKVNNTTLFWGILVSNVLEKETIYVPICVPAMKCLKVCEDLTSANAYQRQPLQMLIYLVQQTT